MVKQRPFKPLTGFDSLYPQRGWPSGLRRVIVNHFHPGSLVRIQPLSASLGFVKNDPFRKNFYKRKKKKFL